MIKVQKILLKSTKEKYTNEKIQKNKHTKEFLKYFNTKIKIYESWFQPKMIEIPKDKNKNKFSAGSFIITS